MSISEYVISIITLILKHTGLASVRADNRTVNGPCTHWVWQWDRDASLSLVKRDDGDWYIISDYYGSISEGHVDRSLGKIEVARLTINACAGILTEDQQEECMNVLVRQYLADTVKWCKSIHGQGRAF
jgi:hypothetical protein